MKVNTGSVVMATAGKEKGQIFIVIKVADGFAFLCDGKRLKISRPKKKSLKHVKLVQTEGLCEEEIEQNERTNALLRKFLSKKRSDACQKTM